MATEDYEVEICSAAEQFLMKIIPNESPARKDAQRVRISNGWSHGTAEFTLDNDQVEKFLHAMQSLYNVAHWSGQMRQTPDCIHPNARE